MEMNYCRRCGSGLEHVEKHIYRCENSHVIFANSSPSVGVFILTQDNKVYLSVRGIEPHKGMLDALGGFCDGEETFEDAIARELKEEAGLDASDYEPVRYLCSGIGGYPYKEEVIPVLSSLYWTRLLTDVVPKGRDDVASLEIITIDEVDESRLHDDDIRLGIQKLKQLSKSSLLS